MYATQWWPGGGSTRPGVVAVSATDGAPLPLETPVTSARSIALSPDGATAYLGRAEAGDWPRAGGLAISTRDGALLGWAPGTDGPAEVDAVAVSGDSVFLDSGGSVDSRRRTGLAMVDETGNLTRGSIPWAGWPETTKLAIDARGTVYFGALAVVDRAGRRRHGAVDAGAERGWGDPDARARRGDAVRDRPGRADGGAHRGRWRRAVAGLRGRRLGGDDGVLARRADAVPGGNVHGASTATPRAGLAAVDAASGAVSPFTLPLPGPRRADAPVARRRHAVRERHVRRVRRSRTA